MCFDMKLEKRRHIPQAAAPDEAARAAAATLFQTAVDALLFGESSTEVVVQAPINLEELQALMQEARKRPFVTEIWFVDRPAEYEQFVTQFPQGAEPVGVLPLARLDMHDWRTDAFDPRTEVIASPLDDDVAALLRRGNMEKIVWPWICAIPGIWLHWSDGRYQMVLTEEGAI